MFSKVSVPPFECGIMWSTSALLGRLLYSQSSIVPHSGQFVSPLLKSSVSRWSLTRRHCAVPVRDEFGFMLITSCGSAVLFSVERLALLYECVDGFACVVSAECECAS